ncbi:hypothetical protein H4F17_14600 [Vibrio cholerae]
MRRILVVSVLSGTLIGCGGSDNDNNGGSERDPLPTKEGVQKVLNTLEARDFTELNEYPKEDLPRTDEPYVSNNDIYHCAGTWCPEDANTPPTTFGAVRRYDPAPDNPIKVFLNNPDNIDGYDAHPTIYEGLKLIEEAIGYDFDLFEYDENGKLKQISVQIWQDNEVTGEKEKVWDADYSHLPYEGGIIISEGTYPSDSPNACASVYRQPWGGTNGYVITMDNMLNKDKGWRWVAFPERETALCNVTSEIVAHEFVHALGISSHFAGFGGDRDGYGGAAFGHQGREVLRLLYNTPINTPVEKIEIPDY